MQPLSLLPVFLDLRGQSVLVAGDSDGMVWKIELVLAAGARVKVFATKADVLAKVSAQVPDADLDTHRRVPNGQDFQGVRFAIGAYDEWDEAEAFAALARSSGVLVNLVDRPSLSDVQFGAIVNRSPIVASIATDGKAPSLGRAIRNQIEALLPPEIAQWALAADELRPATAAMSPPAKRKFWAHYAQFVLAQAKQKPDLDALRKAISSTEGQTGQAIIIGTGPKGRHDLITIEALGYLQRADLIFVEGEVAAGVLDLARREALTISINEGPDKERVLARMTEGLQQSLCVIWLFEGEGPKPADQVAMFEAIATKANASLAFLNAGR